MDDAELVKQVFDSLNALENRLEELKPGITQKAAYPSADAGAAGLSAIFHIMRQKCDLEATARHLEQHCLDLERVQESSKKPPLEISLDEISEASHNHFLPPQIAMNTLDYAFLRFQNKQDAYLGDNGGMKRTTQQEIRMAKTRDERRNLAGWFYALRQQDPKTYPINEKGYAEAADVLPSTPSTIATAVKEANPKLKAAWKSGFPAPAFNNKG